MIQKKNSFFSISGHINFVKHLFSVGFICRVNKSRKKQTQIFKALPLYLDRFIELIRFYPLSIKEFIKVCKEYDLPNTDYFKDKFIKNFGLSDPGHLFDSYKNLDKHYALRLMLTYHRLDFIENYLDFISTYFHNKKINVLDYGCGISDIGLYFVKMGHSVTIVDLATPKFEFTKKRFIIRGLNFQSIDIKDTESLPVIDKKFDLIIATEILEHYRYPIKLTDLLHSVLKKEGLLLNSLGLEFSRESGADHLEESLREGNSITYKKNYFSKFKLIEIPGTEPWLFAKIG